MGTKEKGKMVNTNYSSLVNRGNSSSWQTTSVAKAVEVEDTSSQNNKASTFSDTGVILTLSKQTEGVRLKSTEAATYAATASSATLKVGSKGTAVYELQKNLTRLGYSTNGTDGIFGNDTKNAVVAFQKAYGLTADGIVGAGTQSAIAKAIDYHNKGILTVGSRGARVTELQKNLTKLGYNTNGTDGIFGAGTQKAVILFQRDHGLKQDGMVGSDTWGAINKAVAKLNANDKEEDIGTSLSANGYQFLIEYELGTNLSQYDYIKLDNNGKISAIRNHDVGDGGITVGVGICVKPNNTERQEMLASLGIDWSDTSQWVPIETAEKAFTLISPTYENAVNTCLEKLNKTVTQSQYDALFAMAYNSTALFDKEGVVYKLLAQDNFNIDDWRDELIEVYKGKKDWDKYGKGWTNRIEDQLELFFYGDYKRTH